MSVGKPRIETRGGCPASSGSPAWRDRTTGSAASHGALEFLGVRGPRQRVLVLDELLAHEPRQRFLERERALACA